MQNKKKSKLIIRKSKSTIFTIKILPARNSHKGELDIFMDSAKNTVFDNAVFGYFSYQGVKKISAVSWHGFYTSENGVYKIPKIHFKSSDKHSAYIKNISHYDTINGSEPFAFPICSLYVPQNSPLLSKKAQSPYPLDGIIDYHFLDVPDDQDCRIDIFLTPKNINACDILNTTAGIAYIGSDIDIFNLSMAPFFPLLEFKEIYDGKSMTCLQSKKLALNHDIIMRIVKNQNRHFSCLEGTYSLLIHDPNQAFNRIANRVVSYPEGNSHFIREELSQFIP